MSSSLHPPPNLLLLSSSSQKMALLTAHLLKSESSEASFFASSCLFSFFLSHTVLSKHAELLSSSKVSFFPLSFRPWNMALDTLPLSSLICNTPFMFQLRPCFLCNVFSDSPSSPRLRWCSSDVLPWHLDFPQTGTYGTILKHGRSTCFIAQLTVSSRKAGAWLFLSWFYCQFLDT